MSKFASKFSDDFRDKYKTIVIIVISVILSLWFIVTGVELYINANIVGYNTSIALANKEQLSEEIDDSIEYFEIRVKEGTGNYYDNENGAYIHELSTAETSGMIWRYTIADILCFIMFILLLLYIYSNTAKRIVVIICTSIVILFSYFIEDVFLKCLYNMNFAWIVLIMKIAVFVLVIVKKSLELQKTT